MTITLNGTTGIITPDIDSVAAPDLVGTNFTSLPSGQLVGNLPALNGSSLTSLTSANLTGALPAIDGSALTGVGGSTTFGAVGTYAYGRTETGGAIAMGATASGFKAVNKQASLGSASPYWRKTYGIFSGALESEGWELEMNVTAMSGTWRHMGGAGGATAYGNTGIWVRIS